MTMTVISHQKPGLLIMLGVITASRFVKGADEEKKWPQSDALVGFWPLDYEIGFGNVASDSIIDGKIPSSMSGYPFNGTGPFGERQTSFTKLEETGPLLAYNSIPLSSNFTFSFYLHSSCPNGGIAQFWDETDEKLHFYWSDNQLHVVYGSSNSNLIRTWSPKDVLLLNEWQFFAFVSDSTTIKLYVLPANETSSSELSMSTASFPVLTDPHTSFSIGKVQISALNVAYNFKAPDSIACVMLYNDSLSKEEVQQLPVACRFKTWKEASTTPVQTTTTTTTTTTTLPPRPAIFRITGSDTNSGGINSVMDDVPAGRANNRCLLDVTTCQDFNPKRAAPPNEDRPTEIKVAFEVTALRELETKTQTISASGLLFMSWRVTTCPDNTTELLNDTERLVVHQTNAQKWEVWVPRLRFTSSASNDICMSEQRDADDLIAVYRRDWRSFDFYWSREGLFTSLCEMDLDLFPFDRQTCNFTFELERSIETLQFQSPTSPDNFKWSNKKTPEWKHISNTWAISTNEFKRTSVHQVRFAVTLQRIPNYYLNNLALPNFVLVFLVLFTFCMPPDCPDRSMFAVTALLALTVAQGDLLRELPKTKEPVLLGRYVRANTLLTAAISLYQLTSCWLAHSHKTKTMKKFCCNRITWIRVLDFLTFLGAVAAFIGITTYHLSFAPKDVCTGLL